MEPTDSHALGPGLLPTPFTADEIRQGCPDGRLIRLRIEADGQLVAFRTNRFSAGDTEGATLESQRFAADGTPTGPPEADRVTWRQLQAHAAFPAVSTTRTEEAIETPLGSMACLRYTRIDGDEISTFWFARAMAGMPIRFESEVGGRVTSRVTMIESSMP